jgi:hypothetical protein
MGKRAPRATTVNTVMGPPRVVLQAKAVGLDRAPYYEI